MAAIQNSGGSTAAGGSALPAATAAATPGAAMQVATTAGAAGAAMDVFTQLIAGMISASGGGPARQCAMPPLQDVTTLEVAADAAEPPKEDGDGKDDEATEGEDGALAMAALLPGFACLAPPAPTTAGSSPTSGTDTATSAIESALLARRADVDVSQAAVDELGTDQTDAAGNAPPDSSTTPAASTQSPAPSTQIHALMATHAATRAADVTPDATLRSPVGTPAWKDELGTQLTWMAAKGLESASLRLSPEHLGPLEIRISVRDGEASVYFGATNPDTRSALEQSLPRLRELFASQGLVLADAGVSRDAPRNAFRPPAPSPGPRSVSDAAGETAVRSVTLDRSGLIDTYV